MCDTHSISTDVMLPQVAGKWSWEVVRMMTLPQAHLNTINPTLMFWNLQCKVILSRRMKLTTWRRCRQDNNPPHESFVESDSRARMSYHNHPKSRLHSIT